MKTMRWKKRGRIRRREEKIGTHGEQRQSDNRRHYVWRQSACCAPWRGTRGAVFTGCRFVYKKVMWTKEIDATILRLNYGILLCLNAIIIAIATGGLLPELYGFP